MSVIYTDMVNSNLNKGGLTGMHKKEEEVTKPSPLLGQRPGRVANLAQAPKKEVDSQKIEIANSPLIENVNHVLENNPAFGQYLNKMTQNAGKYSTMLNSGVLPEDLITNLKTEMDNEVKSTFVQPKQQNMNTATGVTERQRAKLREDSPFKNFTGDGDNSPGFFDKAAATITGSTPYKIAEEAITNRGKSAQEGVSDAMSGDMSGVVDAKSFPGEVFDSSLRSLVRDGENNEQLEANSPRVLAQGDYVPGGPSMENKPDYSSAPSLMTGDGTAVDTQMPPQAPQETTGDRASKAVLSQGVTKQIQAEGPPEAPKAPYEVVPESEEVKTIKDPLRVVKDAGFEDPAEAETLSNVNQAATLSEASFKKGSYGFKKVEPENWYEDSDFYSGVANFLVGLVGTGGNPLLAWQFASNQYDIAKATESRQAYADQMLDRGYAPESIGKWVQSGDREDLVMLSQEEIARSKAVKAIASADQARKESGALTQGEVRESALLDLNKKRLSENKLELEIDGLKEYTPASQAVMKHKIDQAKLQKQLSSGDLKGPDKIKYIEDRIKFLQDSKKKSAIGGGRPGKAVLTASADSINTLRANNAINQYYKQSGLMDQMRDASTGKIDPTKSPMYGLFGDLYKNLKMEGSARAFMDNLMDNVDDADVGEETKAMLRSIYTKELDHMYSIDSDRRWTMGDLVGRMESKFLSTGNRHEDFVSQSINTETAPILRAIQAGEFSGTGWSPEDVGRIRDVLTGFEADNVDIDDAHERRFRISEAGYNKIRKRIPDIEGKSITLPDGTEETFSPGSWFTMEEIVNLGMTAGREDRFKRGEYISDMIDHYQDQLYDATGL